MTTMNLEFCGDERQFAPKITYRDVYNHRRQWKTVIEYWDKRMKAWYFAPIERLEKTKDFRDNSFAVFILACVLIDTLSQFEDGKKKSDENSFKGYARRLGKREFKRTISPVIQYCPPWRRTPVKIRDCAQALWEGFRCGIMHQAHAPLYCIASDYGEEHGEGAVWLARSSKHEPREYVQYTKRFSKIAGLSQKCHCVMVDPWELTRLVRSRFDSYVTDLRNSKRQVDCNRFRQKFRDLHGIEIG